MPKPFPRTEVDVSYVQIEIPVGSARLEGDLAMSSAAKGIVVFAHGSGSSRHSSRNRAVAGVLREVGLATLLFDLLTPEEEASDAQKNQLCFNISFLARRLEAATDWLQRQLAAYPIGYFGASTGAAAALVAAANRENVVRAVVSRGGRPDLAGSALPHVTAPTLFIVGGEDLPVIAFNQEAFALLGAEDKQLVIIPGATHLFEEPGTLEEVARLAADWFDRHLRPDSVKGPNPGSSR